VDSLLSDGAGSSQVINYKGKELYTLTTREGLSGTIVRTWVYDNNLQTWVRWATCTTTADVLDDTFTPSQSRMVLISNKLVNVLAQNVKVGVSGAAFCVVIASDAFVFSDTITGAGSYIDYPLEWISETFDFGSRKRKFMTSLEVLFDTHTAAGSSTTDSLILYYRDTDYNSQSPNRTVSRTLNYNSNASSRAIWRQLGSFRRRNFGIKQLGSAASRPFRLRGIEITYTVGETDREEHSY